MTTQLTCTPNPTQKKIEEIDYSSVRFFEVSNQDSSTPLLIVVFSKYNSNRYVIMNYNFGLGLFEETMTFTKEQFFEYLNRRYIKESWKEITQELIENFEYHERVEVLRGSIAVLGENDARFLSKA